MVVVGLMRQHIMGIDVTGMIGWGVGWKWELLRQSTGQEGS